MWYGSPVDHGNPCIEQFCFQRIPNYHPSEADHSTAHIVPQLDCLGKCGRFHRACLPFSAFSVEESFRRVDIQKKLPSSIIVDQLR